MTKLEQLIDETANKVVTEFSKKFRRAHVPCENGSHIPDSTKADTVQFLVEKPDETPVLTLPSLPAEAHKWTIILSGLIIFTGLLLAVFTRKKTIDPQWHVFRTAPGSLITLERRRLKCGGFISHTAKPASATPSSGLWVIEIALNTSNRHRVIKTIKQLELPVARKENNFMVIGPYKQKPDAARVVKELCSGLMKPDTHLGDNARHREVSDDQATSYLYS